MLRALTLSSALLLAAAPAIADERAREPHAVMEAYFRLWNAHDAKAITSGLYKLDPAHPWSTEAGLAAEFKRLADQGYDRSELASMDTCLLSPTQAMTILRFARLKKDGSAMPPKDRASLYSLQKFPEGWRIVRFQGLSASVQISCKSATE